MSRIFRLSISELASVLELVVEVPDSLSVNDQYLNQVATTAVAERWRRLHQNQPDPPWFPSSLQIEAISDFDPSGIHVDYGPFEFANGSRAWITKPIPSLVFRDY
jgi:hypothetical protein